MIIQLIVFLVTLLLLITIHEFGHFCVAKSLGVKVLRFSIGFGKPLWRYQSKAGTEYVIAMLPLGGYVRLLDEREGKVAPEDLPFAFNRKSLWARSAIVLAGPLVNLLFAVFAFWLMFTIGLEEVKPVIGNVEPHTIAARSGLPSHAELVSIDGQKTKRWQDVMLALIKRIGDQGTMEVKARPPQSETVHTYQLILNDWKVNDLKPQPLQELGILPFRPTVPPIIESLLPDSPAVKANLKSGDEILQVNNQPISDWIKFVSYVQKHPNQALQVKLKRDGRVLTLNVQTGAKWVRLRKLGYLGIETQPVSWPKSMQYQLKYSPLNAVQPALQQTWSLLSFNFVVLGKMLMGKISLQSIGGPITIFETAHAAFRQGLVIFIGFLGLLSIMLAFVNILPIPGLDGGHLLLFLIEGIARRSLSLRVQLLIFRLGLIVLVLLIVQASINDLMRLF